MNLRLPMRCLHSSPVTASTFDRAPTIGRAPESPSAWSDVCYGMGRVSTMIGVAREAGSMMVII
jgi:hypothetical protein